MTARISPMMTYVFAPGWACSSSCSPASCSRWCSVVLIVSPVDLLIRNQIHEREDQNPHDVDEVPVQAGDLYEQRMLLMQAPAQGVRHQRHQPEHADEHVRAVEARQGEERRAEQVPTQRQTVTVERGELVELATQEHAAEQPRRG